MLIFSWCSSPYTKRVVEMMTEIITRAKMEAIPSSFLDYRKPQIKEIVQKPDVFVRKPDVFVRKPD
jgi:hypothetical protein